MIARDALRELLWTERGIRDAYPNPAARDSLVELILALEEPLDLNDPATENAVAEAIERFRGGTVLVTQRYPRRFPSPGRCGALSAQTGWPDARPPHSCDLRAGHAGQHESRVYPSGRMSAGLPVYWSDSDTSRSAHPPAETSSGPSSTRELALPTEPGTVIAIGEWWFVRLRPYTRFAHAGWELLPAPEDVSRRLKRMGIATQCVYGNDWVQAEAEQDPNGFRIISRPEGAA